MLTPTLNKRASSIFSTVLAVGRPKNLSTGGLLPPSPVPHLLVSNSPPSEEERDAIKATLVAVKKTYDCWKDSEVGSHSKQDLAQMEDFVRNHETILSTFRIFPAELLALIFEYCLLPFQSLPWSRTSWNFLPSSRLSMVCRKWRSVALNTPTIWGILGDVRISKKTAAKKGNAHEIFLKMVLKRSKGSDLWIYVSAPFMEYDGKSHPIIELLCQYAKQWRVFGIDSSCTILSAFRPVKYNLPRLHSLSLALSGDIGTELDDIFVDVPLLSDVNIRGIYPSHLVLPYHQLMSYQEGTFEHSSSVMGGLADVLQHSADLEHIRLSGMCFNFSVAQHTILKSKRTEMPKLRTLATKLDIAQAHQAHTFFDTLVTPHLEEVRIDGFPGDIIAVLQTLILRSIAPNAQFPLKVLHIRSTNRVVDNVGYLPSLFEAPQVEDLDLDSLLLEVPHLEDLDIDFPPLQVVFGLIAGTKSSRTAGSSTPTARSKVVPFVPKLRRLILRGSLLDIISNAKALTALGRARCEGPEVHTHSGHSTPNDLADVRIPQVTRLEQFRLVTNTLEEAFAAQGHLNGWWDAGPSSRQSRPGSRVETPAAEGKSTPSVAIKFNATDNESLAHDQVQIDYLGFLEWRKALYMEIPELNGEAPSRSRKLDFGFASRLDRFLSTFEQARIDERNIYDLYLSQLHWSLRQLGQLRENHIPGDNKYHFRQRSEALVTKWDRCMQANIADVTPRPGALKWAFKQPVSLVYVPDDDPLRKSRDASNFIYGLEDELHEVDLN